MRYLGVVERGLTGDAEFKIFSNECLIEIKSHWYSSVKQLVNEAPLYDRKNLYRINK
jgi:hypothetical protein